MDVWTVPKNPISLEPHPVLQNVNFEVSGHRIRRPSLKSHDRRLTSSLNDVSRLENAPPHKDFASKLQQRHPYNFSKIKDDNSHIKLNRKIWECGQSASTNHRAIRCLSPLPVQYRGVENYETNTQMVAHKRDMGMQTVNVEETSAMNTGVKSLNQSYYQPQTPSSSCQSFKISRTNCDFPDESFKESPTPISFEGKILKQNFETLTSGSDITKSWKHVPSSHVRNTCSDTPTSLRRLAMLQNVKPLPSSLTHVSRVAGVSDSPWIKTRLHCMEYPFKVQTPVLDFSRELRNKTLSNYIKNNTSLLGPTFRKPQVLHTEYRLNSEGHQVSTKVKDIRSRSLPGKASYTHRPDFQNYHVSHPFDTVVGKIIQRHHQQLYQHRLALMADESPTYGGHLRQDDILDGKIIRANPCNGASLSPLAKSQSLPSEICLPDTKYCSVSLTLTPKPISDFNTKGKNPEICLDDSKFEFNSEQKPGPRLEETSSQIISDPGILVHSSDLPVNYGASQADRHENIIVSAEAEKKETQRNERNLEKNLVSNNIITHHGNICQNLQNSTKNQTFNNKEDVKYNENRNGDVRINTLSNDNIINDCHIWESSTSKHKRDDLTEVPADAFTTHAILDSTHQGNDDFTSVGLLNEKGEKDVSFDGSLTKNTESQSNLNLNENDFLNSNSLPQVDLNNSNDDNHNNKDENDHIGNNNDDISGQGEKYSNVYELSRARKILQEKGWSSSNHKIHSLRPFSSLHENCLLVPPPSPTSRPNSSNVTNNYKNDLRNTNLNHPDFEFKGTSEETTIKKDWIVVRDYKSTRLGNYGSKYNVWTNSSNHKQLKDASKTQDSISDEASRIQQTAYLRNDEEKGDPISKDLPRGPQIKSNARIVDHKHRLGTLTSDETKVASRLSWKMRELASKRSYRYQQSRDFFPPKNAKLDNRPGSRVNDPHLAYSVPDLRPSSRLGLTQRLQYNSLKSYRARSADLSEKNFDRSLARINIVNKFHPASDQREKFYPHSYRLPSKIPPRNLKSPTGRRQNAINSFSDAKLIPTIMTEDLNTRPRACNPDPQTQELLDYFWSYQGMGRQILHADSTESMQYQGEQLLKYQSQSGIHHNKELQILTDPFPVDSPAKDKKTERDEVKNNFLRNQDSGKGKENSNLEDKITDRKRVHLIVKLPVTTDSDKSE